METLVDDPCIFQIEGDLFARLSLSLRAQGGHASSLNDIRGTVEKSVLATGPEGMKFTGFGILRSASLWHDGPCQADPRKPSRLGETVELDGALFGTFDFINGSRQLRVGNKGRVGGIEKDDCLVLYGIINERLQLFLRGHGSGRVVRAAKIDQVDLAFGECGKETILLSTGHIYEAIVTRIRCCARSPGNDVAVHVDGIGGVLNRDYAVIGEDSLNICGIRLGAITDEKLLRRQIDSQIPVLPSQGLSQRANSFGRTVTGITFHLA